MGPEAALEEAIWRLKAFAQRGGGAQLSGAEKTRRL